MGTEERVAAVDPGTVFGEICAAAVLRRAWERVEENAGGPGVDEVTVEEFAASLEANLRTLAADLATALYRPRALLVVEVAKATGGSRRLRIPTVRDRVAQTAATMALTPVLEPAFEDCSFGYRAGRSVQDAIRRVEELRDQGYEWIVEADIDDFFDNVDHDTVLSRLAGIVPDRRVGDLVRLWLTADEETEGDRRPRTRGLPQGAPIAPLLANLYLDRLDEAIEARGLRLVRFADDFVVLCRSRREAESAVRVTEDVLAELKLALDPEKSGITSFLHGMRYLGALFVGSLTLASPRRGRKDPDRPPSRQAPAPEVSVPLPAAAPPLTPPAGEPEPGETDATDAEEGADTEIEPTADYVGDSFLRTLYVQRHGAVLRVEGDTFAVTRDREPLLRLPVRSVDQVVIFGHAMLTSHAVARCLTARIPVYFLSGHGRYYGALVSTFGDMAAVHRAQFDFARDPARRLGLARSIVGARLRSARVLLLRNNRRQPDARVAVEAGRIAAAERGALAAASLDEVRGHEGAGTRALFDGLRFLLPAELGFVRRVRRPPPDPVNSLLSFGSALVFYNLFSMLGARGLHPFLGVLHELRRGHPSLASDLLEEFRAPVVESLVLRLLNTRALTAADFIRSRGPGCFLTPQGRETFLRAFERKMATTVLHPNTGFRVAYRRCMDLQVQELRRHLLGETAAYRPMVLR